MKYFISRLGLEPLEVSYEGVPPCLWCGVPVKHPSMDGPLVCSLCDCGCVRDANGIRRWSAEEYLERQAHRRRVILEIESNMSAANSSSDGSTQV